MPLRPNDRKQDQAVTVFNRFFKRGKETINSYGGVLGNPGNVFQKVGTTTVNL